MPSPPSTTRYVAFLRAINVGGHTVKMDRLRELFEALGLANVETFIASGNVIFESSVNAAALEQQLDDHLHAALGYQAQAFVRSTAELAAIAAHTPFPAAEFDSGIATLHIAFLTAPLMPERQQAIVALRGDMDDFHLDGRELYWLIRGKMTASLVGGPPLGKAIGAPTTIRNVNTIRRLVAKYPAE